MTSILYLLYFFIKWSTILTPTIIPMDDQKLSHRLYPMLSVPQFKNITVDAKVEYITIYIPVLVDTKGGTPSYINIGLKIDPPPRPRAPDTNPPKNAKNKS